MLVNFSPPEKRNSDAGHGARPTKEGLDPLFRDESLGPVVAITRACDEAHAIELANDTEYGLSAAVFTRDTARGLRVARQS